MKYYKVTAGVIDGVVKAPNLYKFNNGEMVEVEPNIIRIDATDEAVLDWVANQNCEPIEYFTYEKDNYASLRESEYPSWKEFADAYVKDDVVGMDVYKAKCLAVKVKYPK